MFNKLIEKDELKYTFTDKRKNYYYQQGGSLADVFKVFVPYLKPYNNFLLQFEKNNFSKNDIQLYIMDTSYCVKCRKHSKNLNVKAFMSKNN